MCPLARICLISSNVRVMLSGSPFVSLKGPLVLFEVMSALEYRDYVAPNFLASEGSGLVSLFS